MRAEKSRRSCDFEVYDAYKKWKIDNSKSVSTSEETNLIVYFKELSKRLSPPTLWSLRSMLKNTLNTKENIDIDKFQNLRSLIKNNSKGYKPKKSLVFEWNQIMNFINNAPDLTYLIAKVILIFGICGAMRCDEISKIGLENIEDLGDKLLVSVNDTKNDVPRKFIIGGDFYPMIKQYSSLRPEEPFTNRYFIKYHNGKCQKQVIGRNKIGEIPYLIASYLKLPNPKKYTGHCFRRTSATLLSNSGANTTMLKQLGGWKSTNIAQGYVENSMKNREQIYQSITSASTSTLMDPKPSTSSAENECAAKITNPKNSDEPSHAEVDLHTFSDDFEINDEDLARIEELDKPKIPKSPQVLFQTASGKKILEPKNKQLIKPGHFLNQKPISVFSKNKEDKVPQSPIKTIGTDHRTGKQTSINPSTDENPGIIYQNCVFHGNIVNNFYFDCDKKKEDKNNNL